MLKIKVDVKSLFKKGVKKRNEDFEVALITGEMGSGKSYLGVYKSEEKKRKVFTNMKSYHSKELPVQYFTSLHELYLNSDPNLFCLLDECSKWFPKDCKVDKAFYEWLQHSRKTNRYVYMIFQEYYMVPNWIRGVAKHVYTTSRIPLINLCRTSYGIPVLDPDTKEWGIQELSIFLYKRNKSIAALYDTDEIIYNEL